MKLIARLSIFTIALLVGASLAFADEDRSGLYVNLGVGIQDFDGDRDLEEDTTYLLGAEYRFGDHWATELRYYSTNPDMEAGGDVEVDQFGLDGIYYFGLMDGVFEPYLAAGAGYAVFDTGSDDMDEAQLNAGGGLRVYLSKRFSFRGDLRAIYGDDDDTLDTLASIGFSYFFGEGGEKDEPVAAAAAEADSDGDGVPDSIDQCPNTPQGVEVDEVGCPLDSDGDGVPDYRDECPDTPKDIAVDERGCVDVTQKITHTLDVKFENNSSELTSGSQTEISRLAEFLVQYPTADAVIEGHTDSSGSAEYNQWMSQRRAEAVKNSLVEDHGIAGSRLSAVGKGEDEPVATNDTAEGRKQNRRVVVVIEAIEDPEE